jgi:putative ATP-grasp target RiPP
MAPFAETGALPERTPVIDPVTQIAGVVDGHGRVTELRYCHHYTGSSTSGSTSTGYADSCDSDSSSDSDHD